MDLHPFSDYQLAKAELLTNVDAILHERFAQNTPVELTPKKLRGFYVNLVEMLGGSEQ